jgi:hypothetical protein
MLLLDETNLIVVHPVAGVSIPPIFPVDIVISDWIKSNSVRFSIFKQKLLKKRCFSWSTVVFGVMMNGR